MIPRLIDRHRFVEDPTVFHRVWAERSVGVDGIGVVNGHVNGYGWEVAAGFVESEEWYTVEWG